ncbi:granzyme B-like isoform X2 [Phycodurus eques]|uniref:granzyme B-like isoform X2 n=1 Tax=Phycodurus eques TaxID=693459 RepID=UPI002ACD3C98|nr:granzyme B-like isoform X2 [Phycodurus eques]
MGERVNDLGCLSFETCLISQCSSCTAIMMHVYCTVFALHLFSWVADATGSSIVGGKVAKPHSKPYMASLQVQGVHKCGGILIREDFVLTAAHCKHPGTTVILGAHNIGMHEKSQQRSPVAKFHPHSKFDGNFSYDIMLLQLKRKAKLNTYVKVIGLPKKDEKIPANTRCTVAGWGQTVGGCKEAPSSDLLKETTEKIQFNFECKNIWQHYFQSDHMTCARPEKKGGVCLGDSGGPLICNTKAHGITAFVNKEDCSNHRIPHVFTKVHPFLPWIKEVMQGNVVA